MTMRIARLIAGVLNIDSIDPDEDLLELGVHSIDTIRIANRLEEEFGFRPRVDEFCASRRLRPWPDTTRNTRQEAASRPSLAAEGHSDASTVLVDAKDRERFESARPGLRAFAGDSSHVRLSAPELDAGAGTTYLERRSSREFADSPISVDQLSHFLSCCSNGPSPAGRSINTVPAGGLYPCRPTCTSNRIALQECLPAPTITTRRSIALSCSRPAHVSTALSIAARTNSSSTSQHSPSS